MFTPMFTNACSPSQMPIAAATYDWNACPARAASREIVSARPTSTANSPITATTPTKPNSSASTAKTKSVCASGR